MSHQFTHVFTAEAAHIDANGHVNNAVWVQWMEELAARHWRRDARDHHRDLYSWVVTRHEIDFRSNVGEGARVTGVTTLRDRPKGARFMRHYRFADEAGRVLVQAQSLWAMIDLGKGKPVRITHEIAAPFLPADLL
ncbi:acyl-CoA thioesterase [Aurantiacibacter gangjinensis]|uniref:Thioesterase n=1 Tax=Aurantiacibacter gangjinensis TaxID=502682 RepID=A0A0G9ML25_9SPHN|nr:thioesterase family protein [Aurantiacibacter gangjinensis]APE27273.1 hypothetical protein BMF35_a0444 [Aurantiacibacter gangjinensis]KLE31387.1 thioesterase [Aurantiacibacter gangjinensis]